MNNREELTLSFRGLGVEVGVGAGFFSNVILQNNRVEKLWSIDPWDASLSAYPTQEQADSDYRHCLDLLRQHGRRSQVVKDRAEVYFEKLAEELKYSCYVENGYTNLGRHLDFVYIDSSHTYAETFLQMALWWSILKYGGTLAGHDYDNCLEVRRAVWTFCRFNGVSYSLTIDEPSSWFIVKEPYGKL